MLVIILTIIGVCIFAAVFSSTEKKRYTRFIDFLNQNREALAYGQTLEFEGNDYNTDTQIVQYCWCLSVIVLTMFRTTSYRIYNGNNSGAVIACVIISLLGGWWGIPWGPIRTIESFVKNASPKVITVGDLFVQA